MLVCPSARARSRNVSDPVEGASLIVAHAIATSRGRPHEQRLRRALPPLQRLARERAPRSAAPRRERTADLQTRTAAPAPRPWIREGAASGSYDHRHWLAPLAMTGTCSAPTLGHAPRPESLHMKLRALRRGASCYGEPRRSGTTPPRGLAQTRLSGRPRTGTPQTRRFGAALASRSGCFAAVSAAAGREGDGDPAGDESSRQPSVWQRALVAASSPAAARISPRHMP